MAVYQRPNSSVWWYEFQIDGQRYRGPTGETSKNAAIAAAERIRKDLKAAASRRERVWTLRELTDDWLDVGRVERRDWRNDESRVRKLFGAELREGRVVEGVRHGLPRNLRVHELTASHVSDLMAARRREGNSGATMNREIALLQALLEHARKRGVRLPQPIEFRDYKARESRGKLRYLSLDEEARLLDALAAKVRRYPNPASSQAQMAQDQFDLVVFLLDTGARYNEVATLTWDVLDFEHRTVNLHRSKVENEGVIVMTSRLHALLVSRRAALGNHTRYIFPAWDRGRRVFDAVRGLSTAGIQATMDALGFNDPTTVSKRGRATPHTFRDTFAARQIAAGATLYEVQHMLGHASPTMTQKYAHMDAGVAQRAAQRLDALHGTPRAIRREGDDPIADRDAPEQYAGRVTTLAPVA